MPKKSNTEEFIKKAKIKYGNKFSYDKVCYKNSKEYVIITCHEHGDFEQIPNSHLSGYGCPQCAANYKLNTESFIIKSKEIHGNLFSYDKVDYKKSTCNVIIICKIHGEFKQKPVNHLSGYGCSKCGDNHQYNNDEFIEKAKIKHNNKYSYDNTNYKNANTKIIITCPIHGNFTQKASEHLFGKGCSQCSNNSGSKKIKIIDNFFENEDVIIEHRFNDCKNINPLPFDRYILKYNLLIEYDGEQHFTPVMHWGGVDALIQTQLRDSIKNQYCIDNNINLLRIKYDEDIQYTIENFMKELEKKLDAGTDTW